MAQSSKKGGGKAGALLKTMGRGSPRTRAPEVAPPAGPEQDDVGPDAGPVGEGEPRRTGASATTGGRGRQAATATKPKRRERPAKPVRITVDLDAGRHRFLRDFAYREDARGTEIMRALLDELADDEGLAERVRDRLAGEG